jgi:chloramphenicol O-acetyltransferase type B
MNMKYTPKLHGGIYVDSYGRGRHTYGEPTVMNYLAPAKLTIGAFCSIADGVEILLGGHHHTDWVSTYPFNLRAGWTHLNLKGYPATKGDVVIGSDVFIGRNAMILSGVTVGDGAVIGAGAVVTKDVRPYDIVVGNPACVVKQRFPGLSHRLLEIAWWNWDDNKIAKYAHLLCSDRMVEFINQVEVDGE